MDIAPTLLDVAGASHPYPKEYKGREVHPLMGKSMLPYLKGKAEVVRNDSEAVASEALGRRAVRQGRWKATWLDKPFGPDGWQLFDIVADPTERNDLSDSNRGKLNELILLWEKYADEVGVVLPSTMIELKD